jgi:hypothetical protein
VSGARKKTKTARAARGFSAQDWRDIYDALMDAANVHHSGPRADRILALARKVREEVLP